MIDFEFKGIKIVATVNYERSDYQDAGSRKRTRFDRTLKVYADFWDFRIWNGNLYEFAFIKSILQYFSHAVPKRSSKVAGKINLVKCLQREDYSSTKVQSLYLVARQKNDQQYLHIYTQKDVGITENEVYLDLQEVMMLDIAFGKAINLLTPYEVGRGF